MVEAGGIEYVCRWCGDTFAAKHDQPTAALGKAHELCAAALAVHGRGRTVEEMLSDATSFELRRPMVT